MRRSTPFIELLWEIKHKQNAYRSASNMANAW